MSCMWRKRRDRNVYGSNRWNDAEKAMIEDDGYEYGLLSIAEGKNIELSLP